MSDIGIVGVNGNVAKVTSSTDVTATLLKRSVDSKNITKDDYIALRNENISHETIASVLKHLTPESDFKNISQSLDKVQIQFEMSKVFTSLIDKVVSSQSPSIIVQEPLKVEVPKLEEPKPPVLSGKVVIEEKASILVPKIEAPKVEEPKIKLSTINNVVQSTYKSEVSQDGMLNVAEQKDAFTKLGIPFTEVTPKESGVMYSRKLNLIFKDEDVIYKNAKNENITIKPTDKCVIRKTDNPDEFEIVKLKIDGKRTTIEENSKGIITREMLNSFKTDNSFKKLPIDSKLFSPEGKVSPKDVIQGQIGDCYLMASLENIAKRTPLDVYNMIKDNGNGTVTVRLFDVKGEDGDKTFTPKFVTFEKSLPTNGKHSEGALWVQMIEKAYALEKGSYEGIGGGGQMSDVFETLTGRPAQKIDIKHTEESRDIVRNLFTSPGSLYEGYSFDDTKFDNFASEMENPVNELGNKIFKDTEIEEITNKKDNILIYAKTVNNDFETVFKNVLNKLDFENNPPVFKDVGELRQELATLRADIIDYNRDPLSFPKDFSAISKKPEDLEKELKDSVKASKLKELLKTSFGTPNSEKCDTWNAVLKNSDFKSFVATKIEPIIKKSQYAGGGGQIRREEIMFEINQAKSSKTTNIGKLLNSVPKEIMDKFMDSLTEALPGKRFTGVYTKKQSDLFETIKSKVGTMGYIGIATNESVGRGKVDEKGRSSGEPISKGLAGRHAFAITNVKEEGGIKYVEISNPWGEINRTYEDKEDILSDTIKKKPVKTQEGTSWIELSDISKRFHSLYIS